MSKYIVFLMAILIIAATSIGIQCIGDDKTKASNKKYLVYMLIGAILALLGSGFMIFKRPAKVVVETTNVNMARGNVNAAPAGLKQA
jgi:hypothetical protein